MATLPGTGRNQSRVSDTLRQKPATTIPGGGITSGPNQNASPAGGGRSRGGGSSSSSNSSSANANISLATGGTAFVPPPQTASQQAQDTQRSLLRQNVDTARASAQGDRNYALATQSKEKDSFNPNSLRRQDIDFYATVQGGFPKPGKVTAQTYLNQKIGQGLGFITDKIATRVPEGKAKDILFEKKYSYDFITDTKLALTLPGTKTGAEFLSSAIRSGSLIPETKTTFFAIASRDASTGITSANIISRTETLGMKSTGIGRSFLKERGANQFLGIGKSYTLTPTKKGLELTQISSVSRSNTLPNVFATLSSKEGVLSKKIADITGSSTKTFYRENVKVLNQPNSISSGLFKTNLQVGFKNTILKTDSKFTSEETVGFFRALNKDKTAFLFKGSSYPDFRTTGVGANLGDFNIRGVVIRSASESFSSLSNLGKSRLGTSFTKTEQKAISNQIGSIVQSSQKSIIDKVTSPIIKSQNLKIGTIASSSVSQIASVSAFYGKGQYERTSPITGLSVLDKPQSNNLFSNNLISLPSPQRNNNFFTTGIPRLDLSQPSKKSSGLRTISMPRESVSNFNAQVPTIIPTQTPRITLTPIPRINTTPSLPRNSFFTFGPRGLDYDFKFPVGGGFPSLGGYSLSKPQGFGRKSSFNIAPSFSASVLRFTSKSPIKVSRQLGVNPFQSRPLLVGKASRGSYFKLTEI